MKKCTKCGLEKPTTAFTRCCQTKDGFNHRCKTCYHIIKAIYFEENKEKLLIKSKAHYAKNTSTVQQTKKKWKDKNPEYHKEYWRIYEKEKLETDINFKIKKRLRSRLKSAIKNNYKSGSAVRDLGCSINFLKVT